MAKISEVLKIMITTEKMDFGSYSHFTDNVTDIEKDVLYKICKYNAAAPLNGSRELQHSAVSHNKVLYHIYYKHYQVIGFDKKGRPSSNLISCLLRHSLSTENCELLNKRFDSILHDLDKQKGHFTIHKHYTINFFYDNNLKLKSLAASFRKSYKYIILAVFGVLLFFLFIHLDATERSKKHSQMITAFETKSFFDEIDLYNISLDNTEYLEDMNKIILTKGDKIASLINNVSDYRSFLKSYNSKALDHVSVLNALRSTKVYSTELEKKILFFAKVEKEYIFARDSKNVRKIKKYLKQNGSYLTESDKLVLLGIIDELSK